MPSNAPDPNVLTLKRQSPSAGALLAALEAAWHAIREHHADLPGTQIVVAGSSWHHGRLLLGHLAPERWEPLDGRGQPVHELLIAGEGLSRGALDVFTTTLHEAGHALALARGIADTSRDGRYHNQRYHELANELGLHVQRDLQTGWSETTLRPATRARYQPVIDALARTITRHRLREPPPVKGRNLAAAACACPRRIRVAPRTLDAGAITCQVCQQPFTRTETPTLSATSTTVARSAAPARRASNEPRGPVEIEAPRPAAGLVRGSSLHVCQPIPDPAPGGGHNASPEELAGAPRRPFDSRSATRQGELTSSHERTAERPNHQPREQSVMAAQNLNHVVLTGNLTSDPELRSLPSGTTVCKLRIAVNTRRKNGSSGEWEDKANFFDVVVWGAQGENAARFLSRGRSVGVQGRLEWREWETPDGGKRQAVEIVAENVQFLGAPANSNEDDIDTAVQEAHAAVADADAAAAAKTTGKRGSRSKREPAAVGAGPGGGDAEIAF